jgi:SPP1 family predicted phage head-tail adaptor
VPAKVQTLNSSSVGESRKAETARQLVPTATHQVTLRFMPNITENNNRFIFEGLILNIGAVMDKNNRHFTVDFLCMADKSSNGVI